MVMTWANIKILTYTEKMISGSVILGFTIAICLLLSSIAVESLRGSSRILLDEELREERKQQKRDHWKLTQLMDYGEKVIDNYGIMIDSIHII